MKYEDEADIDEPLYSDTKALYNAWAHDLDANDWFSFWGPVTDAACELCAMFIMRAMFANKKQVNIILCSPGGEEDDTRALLGVMELAKASGLIIRVYGAGIIASAAFDIFAACSKGYRFCFEATMFMTHSSAGHVEDRAMYKLQERFDEWTLKKYTSIHAATRRRMLDTGNWWFDPGQAIAYGVADAIVDVGDRLPEGPVYPKRKSIEQQQREAGNVGETIQRHKGDSRGPATEDHLVEDSPGGDS